MNQQKIFAQIEEVVSQRTDLRLIDRERTDQVKKELAFQQSDWSSKIKTAKIGDALNAVLICLVTIYSDSYKVEFLNVKSWQKRTYNGKVSVGFFFGFGKKSERLERAEKTQPERSCRKRPAQRNLVLRR